MQSLQERCLADKFDCVSFTVITPLMIILGTVLSSSCQSDYRLTPHTAGLAGTSYNLVLLRGSPAKFQGTTWFYLRALSVTDILYLLFMIGYLVNLTQRNDQTETSKVLSSWTIF